MAYFVFDSGTLTLTEAGTKRRASLYVFSSSEQLANSDPGGLEVLEASLEEFSARLRAENHTLKRSLTDPRTFSGIGNAYSDEILHRARLSPVALTQKLTSEAISRLYEAIRVVMTEWTGRLREEARESFPGESHRVPAGDGGSRPLRQTLSGVRDGRATHPLCGK